jgi:hypothetical protein
MHTHGIEIFTLPPILSLRPSISTTLSTGRARTVHTISHRRHPSD